MHAKSAKELEAQWTSTSWFRASSEPPHRYHAPNLRLRRTLSWLDRAEQEYCRRDEVDEDAGFIFYWIAFNSAYGQLGSAWSDPERESESFKTYLEKIIHCDYQAIKEAIFPELVYQIRTFVNNKYVYQPFWTHHNREQGHHQDWERGYRSNTEAVLRALSQGSPTVLRELFYRLYTLRNQLLHGGATWKSSVNRHQVEAGARIMSSLVPHFIEVMIEHPNDWGPPRYPVVQERGPQSGWTGTG